MSSNFQPDPEKTTRDHLVSIVHEALSTFDVQIYNGSDQPHLKPLPEALTSISCDLKNVKLQLVDIKPLIVAQQKRRKMIEGVNSIIDWMRLKTYRKIIVSIATIATSVYGIIELITKLIK